MYLFSTDGSTLGVWKLELFPTDIEYILVCYLQQFALQAVETWHQVWKLYQVLDYQFLARILLESEKFVCMCVCLFTAHDLKMCDKQGGDPIHIFIPPLYSNSGFMYERKYLKGSDPHAMHDSEIWCYLDIT